MISLFFIPPFQSSCVYWMFFYFLKLYNETNKFQFFSLLFILNGSVKVVYFTDFLVNWSSILEDMSKSINSCIFKTLIVYNMSSVLDINGLIYQFGFLGYRLILSTVGDYSCYKL